MSESGSGRSASRAEPADRFPGRPGPSTTAVVIHGGGRADALTAAAALALAAVVTALVPVIGAVRAADGAPLWFAPGALWITLLPAVLVAVLAMVRPVAALAVAAGAGVMGAARLLADLPVLTAPDALARPDLFVETTDRSLPLHPAAGGYLLLAADLITIGAGVLAAVRLSGRLSFQRGDGPDAIDGAEAGGADETGGGRPRRHYLLTLNGFVAVPLLALAALGVPYQGGYLAARYLAAGVPLAGMLGALLLAVLVATAVLVAGTLPRPIAVAVLGGAALGACLPYLVALVAVVSAPVELSGTVWIGLIGGLVLVAAGLLTSVRSVSAIDDDGAVPAAPSPLVSNLAGAAALLAAGLAVLAALMPALDAGGLEDLLTLVDGSPIPGSTLFAAAAVPLAIAAGLSLVPVTRRAGRAALMVVWAALVPAMTLAVQVLSDDGLAAARDADLVAVGPGTWFGVAALVVAVLAAVLAAIAASRAAEADAAVPDDESVAAARGFSLPVAVALGALAVVADCLPVYGTAGQIQGPTILQGYTVQAWGAWAVLLAAIGAVAAAAVTRHRWVVLACGVAAAGVQAVRLVVPASVPEAAGFGLRPGAVVQAVLIVALLGGAVALAARAARIRTVYVGAVEVDVEVAHRVPGAPAGTPRKSAGRASSGSEASTRVPRNAPAGAARRPARSNRRNRR